MPNEEEALMTKPKPSQEGGSAVEVEEIEEADEDEASYDDEQPLWEPDEAGR